MRKNICFLLFLITFFSACRKIASTDLKEEVPYYQHYTVSYDKSLKTTEASAYFRSRSANGLRIELTGEQTIKANSTDPKKDAIDKTLYKWALIGTPGVNFSLYKSSGTKIYNDVSLGDISDLDIASGIPMNISKSAEFSFTWTGDSLTSEESLDIQIITFDSHEIAVKNLKMNNSQFKITFSPDELKKLALGDGRLQIARRKVVELDETDSNAGGSIDLEVRVHKDVKIVP